MMTYKEHLSAAVDALANSANTFFLEQKASRRKHVERAALLAVMDHFTNQLALIQLIATTLAEHPELAQGMALDFEGEPMPF